MSNPTPVGIKTASTNIFNSVQGLDGQFAKANIWIGHKVVALANAASPTMNRVANAFAKHAGTAYKATSNAFKNNSSSIHLAGRIVVYASVAYLLFKLPGAISKVWTNYKARAEAKHQGAAKQAKIKRSIQKKMPFIRSEIAQIGKKARFAKVFAEHNQQTLDEEALTLESQALTARAKATQAKRKLPQQLRNLVEQHKPVGITSAKLQTQLGNLKSTSTRCSASTSAGSRQLKAAPATHLNSKHAPKVSTSSDSSSNNPEATSSQESKFKPTAEMFAAATNGSTPHLGSSLAPASSSSDTSPTTCLENSTQDNFFSALRGENQD